MNKAENLKDIEFYGHSNLCLTLLQKWKAKSNNPELKDFTDSFLQVLFYSNRLQQDRFIHNKILNEYSTDKVRAIVRARNSEAETDKLKIEIKKLKSLTNL
tara:strand:+ start:3168 stop:3470 length:303 start_codon:yes stop_codon:yes gene_type:complete